MPGTTNLDQDIHIHALLKRLHQSGKAIAALCAAPLVLANEGLLNNKNVSCYPGILSPTDWPEIKLSNDTVVIDGNILTSRGPGPGRPWTLLWSLLNT